MFIFLAELGFADIHIHTFMHIAYVDLKMHVRYVSIVIIIAFHFLQNKNFYPHSRFCNIYNCKLWYYNCGNINITNTYEQTLIRYSFHKRNAGHLLSCNLQYSFYFKNVFG